ncbi:ribosome-associated protein [Natronobacillus azotifigens]|uniref:Ribosomal silencing factor RsfS n=1 Tax=Natronobacillus azotifigens TaxID=472978 RepID=A0A9J6R9K0_9BACI|nr:ribosome silencing factor [Natronobacillus azotifigens]MCZ0702320.1 ribosome silencing factor [Natronobacillus azotifigens]
MDNEEVVKLVAKAADDKRANDIIALNMQDVSVMADYFLICDANSERQVQAIAREIKEQAEENEIPVKRIEGLDQARWILIDLGDVVCHIFHQEERNYYNLERLWGDAALVSFDFSIEEK